MVLLKATDVSKSFNGNVVVDNVNIEINEGEIVGLIGANGAGKTTLFNCLSGYYKVDSGNVHFENKKIDKLPANRICKLGLGRTFQIAKPFNSLTVLENVAVGAYNRHKTKKEAYEKAEEYIKFTGLSDKTTTLAGDLNTGEQRKLELARVLATEPKLLLLDEVMAGLTPTESVEMTALIRKIRDSGVTILMIEHIMPALMSLSDRVYVLDRGALICSGTPEQVSKNKLVIESYLGKSKES